MSTLLKEFPELVKCIEDGHINAVKNVIQMGNSLHIIKEEVEHKKENWLEFIEENFSATTESCHNFITLAKTPIHENHYKYGIEKLLELIKEGHDVSQPVIDPHCQGCQAYENKGEWCLNITDNQTGNCPCSDCASKSNCEDLCLNWYDWDDWDDSV